VGKLKARRYIRQGNVITGIDTFLVLYAQLKNTFPRKLYVDRTARRAVPDMDPIDAVRSFHCFRYPISGVVSCYSTSTSPENSGEEQTLNTDLTNYAVIVQRPGMSRREREIRRIAEARVAPAVAAISIPAQQQQSAAPDDNTIPGLLG